MAGPSGVCGAQGRASNLRCVRRPSDRCHAGSVDSRPQPLEVSRRGKHMRRFFRPLLVLVSVAALPTACGRLPSLGGPADGGTTPGDLAGLAGTPVTLTMESFTVPAGKEMYMCQ